ncbi:MAG: ABC transporter substrate-binding protein [Deltaproteobacteria bacterium]|nr:ABC transporter substrate-binding protein [Deltaproteobacteria bacterium]
MKRPGSLALWAGLGLALALAALGLSGPGTPAAAGPGALPLVVGVPTSLGTVEGADSLLAVRLAVGEINQAGGVLVGRERRRLRVVACDLDDANPAIPPARSVAKLAAFLAREKPAALLVGPFRSEVLLESMDLLAAHRLPTLVCIAMSPAVNAMVLRNPKYRYIFRVGLNTKYLVNYLIQSMKLLNREYGFDRVYILNQDVAWARSTASLMIRLYFERSRWHITGQENIGVGSQDYITLLDQARSRQSQVLLAIFDMPSSARLIEQWHARQPSMVLCGFISPANSPHAWQEFQGRLAGVMNMVFELGSLPSSHYPPSAAFYRNFQARYGRPVQAGHGVAPAYDAVHILAQALTRAGSLDPERLVTALEATDYRGAQGRVHFHPGHQAVFGDDPDQDSVACLLQWQAPGKRVIIYPPKIAEGQLKMQPPPAPQP